MKGIVTDIQRFSVHDGPGIRTTVFLKGCGMRCAWCHNPEALLPRPQLQTFPAKCIACGACVEVCPRGAHEMRDGRHVFHRDRCAVCGACARVCYAGALVMVGREMTAEQVLAEVLEDRAFYEHSDGGVTLSGGEPLFQREFAAAILALCHRQGIQTAIETNLACTWEDIAVVLHVTDILIIDIKLLDPAAHQLWTGASNELILENARRISLQPKPLIVRTPIVPGVNDTPDEIARITDFIDDFQNLLYYELLPYHPLGHDKYDSLGFEYTMGDAREPDPRRLEALADVVRCRDIAVRIAGAVPAEP